MKTIYSVLMIVLMCFSSAVTTYADSFADGYLHTPNAADLGRYGEIPMSYYTGRANVTIPLYSTEQNGSPLDITLSYDGSGIQMNTLPGWVGHNWTILNGGCISRIKNRIEDEYQYPSHLERKHGKYGNYFKNYSKVPSLTVQEVRNYDDNNDNNLKKNDYSADIFVFNVGNLSGKFFLGNDGEWKVDCDQNIRVEFDINNPNNYILPVFEEYRIGYKMPKTIKGFTLIDDSGIRYRFGSTIEKEPSGRVERESATSAIEYVIPFSGIGENEDDIYWSATSWYLTSIEDRFGNILYSFHYSRGYFVANCQRLTYDGKVQGEIQFPYSFSLNSPVYLDSIKTLDNTTIKFDFENAFQTDSTAYKSVYDFSISLEKLFCNYLKPQNGHSLWYLQSDEYKKNDFVCEKFEIEKYRYPYTNKRQYQDETNSTRVDPLLRTGLKYLDNIVISYPNGEREKKIQLEYSNIGPRMHLEKVKIAGEKDDNPQIYQLSYNSWANINKCDYMTTNADHWGYYKKIWDLTQDPIDCKEAIFCTDGLLKSISYPTGGTTTFEYEQNVYNHYRYQSENKYRVNSCPPKNAGGVRVKSISNYVGKELVGKKTFAYENGELYGVPKYEWDYYIVNLDKWWPINEKRSNSIVPLKNSNGCHIGYTNVTEYNQDGTYCVYEYTNFSNTDPDILEYCVISSSYGTPYDTFSEMAFLRGKLLSQKTYDKQGKILHEITNKYRLLTNDSLANYAVYSFNTETFTICNFTQQQGVWPVEVKCPVASKFRIFYPKYDVVATTEKRYENGKTVVNTTEYEKVEYQNNRYTRSVTTKWNAGQHPSDNSTCDKIVYKYSFDYFGIVPTANYDSKLAAKTVGGDWIITELVNNTQGYCKRNNFYPVISTSYYHNNTYIKSENADYWQYSKSSSVANDVIMRLKCQYTNVESLPSEVSNSKDINGLTKKLATDYIQYLAWNEYGLPTKLQKKGFPVTYLFWDKTKLLAEVTSGEENCVPVYNGQVADPLMRVTINGVSAYKTPCTSCRVFSYNPKKQIESITNELGITEYYRYDSNGRLATVLNKDKNVVSAYDYHIQNASDGYNYVIASSVLDKKRTKENKSLQYYDGLGRPSFLSSNASNSNGSYLCSLVEYDNMGRESKQWNPVPCGTNGKIGALNMGDKSKGFYNDSYAFSLTEYDELGRTKQVTNSGNSWHQKSKSVKYSYGFCGAKEVKKYDVINPCNKTTYYKEGDLSFVKHVDEDEQVSVTYTDSRGLTIMERKGKSDTYYVYDDRNNLVWVLQPMFQEEPDLAKFAFKYTYDSKNRLQKKTIPGCSPVEYRYNSIGRVVCTIDEEGMYKYNIYDALGRMCIEGYSYDPEDLSNAYAKRANNGAFKSTGYKVFNLNNDFDSSDSFDVTIVNYYDDQTFLSLYGSYPIEGLRKWEDMSLSERQYQHGNLTGFCQNPVSGGLDSRNLKVNYYDDFGRPREVAEILLGDRKIVHNYTYTFTGDVESDSFSYYLLQPSKKYSKELWGKISNIYDFPHNNLLHYSVISLTTKNGSMQKDTIQNLTYDDFGHVISNNRSGTAGDMSYTYDKLHGWTTQIKSAGGFEQNLYRETTGKQPRWNGCISAMTWKNGNDYLRRYDYGYDELNRLKSADYSYSKIRKTAKGDPTLELIPRSYENENYSVYYGYDKNSNVSSIHRLGKVTIGSKDGYDTVEDGQIERNGNQLKKYDVSASGDPFYGNFEFEDGADKIDEYRYNRSGAMTRDDNRGITLGYSSYYGHLSNVQFDNGAKTDYCYLPDGRKLRTLHLHVITARVGRKWEVLDVLSRDTTTYVENLIIRSNAPDMFLFPGGYYTINDKGSIESCHYYVQDYQGNNRMVVNARTNEIEQNTHYYPYGELIGDISTNSSVQDYKYGGKELDRTYGLDLYDFEARQLDSKLGGFTSIDPLAEKYYSISPYAYCAGDPVNCVDPTGLFIAVADPNDSTGTSMLTYNYIKGKFVDGNGNVYSGNNAFVNNITYELNMINNGKEGSMLLLVLCLSEKGVKISSGEINSERARDGAIYSLVTFSGTTMVKDGCGFTSLAHELAHSWDRINETLNMNTWYNASDDGVSGENIPEAEKYATFIENKVRAEHLIPLRTHYSIDVYGNPSGGKIVDSNGRSYYYKDKYGSHNRNNSILRKEYRYKY